MKKRGQAALEFLMTYGWAFLGLGVVIVALFAVGAFDFIGQVKEKCDFGPQIGCDINRMQITGTPNGFVEVNLVNNYGVDINITNVRSGIFLTNGSTYVGKVSWCQTNPPACKVLFDGSNSVKWASAGTGFFTVSFHEPLLVGKREKVFLNFVIHAVDSTINHSVTGFLESKVR